MVTSAVSPFQRYSSESADCGSIQPVPVVPITTSTSRDQASVRSSSLTARAARSSAVGALSTPDVDADRLFGGLAAELLEGRGVGAAADEAAALEPERVPA